MYVCIYVEREREREREPRGTPTDSLVAVLVAGLGVQQQGGPFFFFIALNPKVE